MSSNTHSLLALMFLFIFAFLLSISGAQVPQDFLQCLSDHSPSSSPISELVYSPNTNNSEFQSVLESTAQNLRFLTPDTPKPQFIITPLLDSHVQAIVICSRQHGYQIKTRSGGHDFEGLSYTSDFQPFIILDLVRMKSIDIDIADNSAWIQTGVTNGELLYQLAITSDIHAFPTGTYPSVGVGGLISGGGMGVLLRKYGLSSDNILDARIVDAEGNILDQQTMGNDLFWAIRGGGGASFCVIVAWKLKLVPIPANLTMFALPKTLAQGASQLFYQWQTIGPELPEDVYTRAIVTNVAGEMAGNRTVQIEFVAIFLGTPTELVQIMNAQFPELGVQTTDCIEVSFAVVHLRLNDYPANTTIDALAAPSPGPKTYSKSKSDFVTQPISQAALDGLWEMYLEQTNTLLLIDAYGGRMSAIPESEFPFPHRQGNIYSIMYFAMWTNDSDSNRQLGLIESLYNYMTPYVSNSPRSAYVNNRDLDIGRNSGNTTSYEQAAVWGTKCFKNNFRRLALVKGVVDPSNFFMNEQSVPPVAAESNLLCRFAGFACSHTFTWPRVLKTLWEGPRVLM